jgi:hypothetical protein
MSNSRNLADLLDSNGDVKSGALDNVPPADVVNDTTPQLGGDLTSNGNDITFGDNDKAIFGAGSDLEIYSDGANAIVDHTNTGAGALYLAGDNNVFITNQAKNETKAVFASNGAVTLYYDNNLKLATTSAGIDVTGTVTADGLMVGQSNVLDFQSGNGEKILSPAAGVLSIASRGNVDIYVDTNDNDGTNPTEFNIYKKADVGVATSKIFSATKEGDISFYEDTGTTPKFFWDASLERLGIGTSSPYRDLHIGTTSKAESSIGLSSSTSGSSIIAFQDGDGSPNRYMGILGYYHSDDSMRFNTNATERMRIDSAGRVTMPYQPAFFAIGPSQDENVQSGVQAFNVQTDNMSWWSSANKRYTVQADGKYLVILDTMRNPRSYTGDSTDIQLRKNGSTVTRAYTQVAADRHPHMGCNAILSMSSGDYIDLYSPAYDVYAATYTSLSIMKVA